MYLYILYNMFYEARRLAKSYIVKFGRNRLIINAFAKNIINLGRINVSVFTIKIICYII